MMMFLSVNYSNHLSISKHSAHCRIKNDFVFFLNDQRNNKEGCDGRVFREISLSCKLDRRIITERMNNSKERDGRRGVFENKIKKIKNKKKNYH